MNAPSNCPVCQHQGLRHVGGDGTFDAWRCIHCEAAFVHPIPSADETARYYSNPDYFGGNVRGGYSDYDEQTAPLLYLLDEKLKALEKPGKTLSILDYGCAYGTHLKLAAERGWQCFGVELSDHARGIARERLGDGVLIGKHLADLVPHCYDLIIMLDVIEHLADPRRIFYEIFRVGGIGPRTEVLITTPNALCLEAVNDLLSWKYYHPPYHLVYYSAASLALLFDKLRFPSVRISGIHPKGTTLTADDSGSDFFSICNQSFAESGGLLCEASGSDFKDFMQERYVPGTWSALSAWEHLPRYLLAQEWCHHKRVLDFGCGSGYGTSILAKTARAVVGLDINEGALAWACAHHSQSNVIFAHVDKADIHLEKPFDIITCFEVIEHLKQFDQALLMDRLVRWLAPDGVLLISTPNPKVTKKYGENPHHLHELGLEAFKELLNSCFACVKILNQDIGASISFTPQEAPGTVEFRLFSSDQTADDAPPSCWLALCAKTQLSAVQPVCYLDTATDLIGQHLDASHKLEHSKMDSMHLRAEVKRLEAELVELRTQRPDIINLRNRLETVMESVEQWQGSWIKRILYRWRPPSCEVRKAGFWHRLKRSVRKRRDRLMNKLFGIPVPAQHNVETEQPNGTPAPNAKVDPILMKEASDVSKLYRKGLLGLNPSKKTVILVTHEISRTGAPILVLNMAQELRQTYNIIILTLNGGSLVSEFTKACDVLMGPFSAEQLTPGFFTVIFEQLVASFPVTFAVINSIVSSVVLKPLWENDVPSIHLIHEFASYTRPRALFCESAFYSSVQIFPASIVRQNAISEYSETQRGQLLVLPQGLCNAPNNANDPQKAAAEQQHIRAAFRPPGCPRNAVVVLGMGTIQLRKGVDLFIACAKQVLERKPATPFRFVWIGHKYDPEHELNYDTYLEDQIQRSGLKDNLTIINEIAELDTVYNESDILFLSSRLDPLPLVSMDAMSYGKPVVCFKEATGIAEYLSENQETSLGVVPYLDIEAAADCIYRLIEDPSYRLNMGKAGRELAESRFSLKNYLSHIDSIGAEQVARKKTEIADRALIAQSNLFREDFFCSTTNLRAYENPVKHYMREWVCGILPRKPFPGFHPGIYAERNAIKGRDPLAHYIEAGQPDGAWRFEVIEGIGQVPSWNQPPKVALHLHLYFHEMADEIFDYLKKVETRIDLLISVSTSEAARKVESAANNSVQGKVDIRIVPNRGRDIGPLLTEFGGMIQSNYDFIGHIHAKKSMDISNQAIIKKWIGFLYENLLGGKKKMADIIIHRMASDKTIGLVFPDDPHVVGWEKNKHDAITLAKQLNIADLLPKYALNFPVGTMFWARTAALKPLFNLGLRWDDYPQEPLAYDGSMLHAIERILPFVVESAGFRNVVTHVDGITR